MSLDDERHWHTALADLPARTRADLEALAQELWACRRSRCCSSACGAASRSWRRRAAAGPGIA